MIAGHNDAILREIDFTQNSRLPSGLEIVQSFAGFIKILGVSTVLGATRMKSQKMTTVAGLVLLSAAVQAQDPITYTAYEIRTDHDVNGSIMMDSFISTDQKNLIIKGEDSDRRRLFSIYGMGDDGSIGKTPLHQIEMPENALFYDFAAVFEKDVQTLLFLDNQGVSYYDVTDKSIKRLVESPSIYLQDSNPLFQSKNFARDVSGDEIAEVIIPDFRNYHLFQWANDAFNSYDLDMQVEMRIGGANPRTPQGSTPRYSEFPKFSFDVNFDGRKDLVFLIDQDFIVFPQKEDGGYETAPISVPLGLSVTGNSWVEQVRLNERYTDQTNLAETTIHRIQDLNDDDIVDIMTETDNAAGVFNRRTEYRLHLGRSTDGVLSFDTEPSSSFEVKGLRYQTRFVDLDNDGRSDFGTASVKVGIGKIIGALISGSTDATLSFFKHSDGGVFSEKPIYSKGVPVKFNLSAGNTSIPFVEVKDVDGDELLDLVLNDGKKGIKIYRGETGKRSFSRKAVKYRTEMPKSGNMVDMADLNGDGKSDIVIHFDRLGTDGVENRNRVIVHLSE